MDPPPLQFLHDLHLRYIERLDDEKDSLEYLKSDHLRMGGIFWGLGSLDLMGCLDDVLKKNEESNQSERPTREGIIRWVSSCWDEEGGGGYGSNIHHDGHMTSSLYAVLVLIMVDGLATIPKEELARWVLSLQNPDGSFAGDRWGEVDGRFMLSAVCILAVLDKLKDCNVSGAIEWISRCQNPDGAFGPIPGAESHAAYVFCCLGALTFLGGLDIVDKDRLGQWLANRQLSGRCGGFNGRPEKAPDVCYSWWILASLKMIGRDHWIDGGALRDFILRSQDTEDGGIADRAADLPDIFHTFFGISGLSLIGGPEGLRPVHPVFCLSLTTLQNRCPGRGLGGFYEV